MKKAVQDALRRSCFLAVMLSLISISNVFAQTPGLIIRPATNGGEVILDPNTDGYISTTTTGFPASNDIGPSVSEIPYRPLPMLTTEPIGDVNKGDVGGHTDFASPSPLQAYYDGTNLMFRMRVGGTSSSQRGYSVLIDSDNTFAGTGANPGFEYEIVYTSGVDVKLIQHTGTTKQVLLSGTHRQFSQRAQAASTAGGNADYFLDFYVPVSIFGGSITPSSPLRMVGSTFNIGQSVLDDLTQVGDVAGVDFRSYNQEPLPAWRDIIDTFPPVTLNDLVTGEIGQIRTFPPIISSPITTASTVIAGFSREPAGTLIRVLRNGSVIGTTTVTDDGTWAFTVPTGVTLAEGNQITATATATGRPISVVSNTVIVTGAACATPIPTFTISNNGRSASGNNAIPNSTIRIYRNGVLITTVTANNGGNWSYAACGPAQSGPNMGTDNCLGIGEFTITQQPPNGCESGFSVSRVVGLSPGSPIPTLGPTPVCVSTTTLSGTTAAGAFVTLFLNDRPLYLVRTTDNAYTLQADASGNWSFTANLGYSAGDRLFVRSRTATTNYGQSTTATVETCQTSAPVITGDYCGTTTVVSGTSTEPAGTTIQIYVAGEPVGEPGTVNENGFWTVSEGLEIPAGTAFTARATAPGEAESLDSEPMTATAQTTNEGLTINGPLVEGSSTIIGTGIGGATLTLYIGGTPYTPIVIPPDGIWSLTGFATTELFPGASITATQTVTGQCESEQIDPIFVECTELTNTFSVSSDTDAVLCGGSGTVSITLGGSQMGVAYSIILPNGDITGSSVMGTGDPITLTSAPIANTGTGAADVVLRVLARRVTGTLGPDLPESCETILQQTITRTILPQPATDYVLTPLSSTICAGSTVNIQLSTSTAGYTYQLINEVTNELVGTAVEGQNGPIILSTGQITGNHSYGVVIANLANGCVYTDPSRYTTTISGPAIDRPFVALEERVCVGGSTTLFISTQPRYAYNVYLEGNAVPLNGTNTPIIGTANGINFPITTPGTAGTYTYYVTVNGGGCPTPVRFLQTATIETTDTPATASVGEDRSVCGTQATLVANQASPGTGLWSVESRPEGSPAPNIINASNPIVTVNNLVPGEYVFRWTVTVTCGETTSTEFDELTLTVNCPSTYVILPPKYRDEYVANELLAYAIDPDGGIASATLVSGTIPAGMDLNTTNGDIFVTNPEALQTGLYTFSVQLTDAAGFVTVRSVTIEILENSPVIVPLPVELVYFTAWVRNNQAHLEWLTASELDNDRFEIERSHDARRFEKIGEVKGKGTTSLETKYQFTDRTPVEGTVYYRLKQVDFDGQFAYSNVITVTANGLARELTTQAYPNPFRDNIKVTLMAPQAQPAAMTIYDINGREVMSRELNLDAGVNNLELQLSELRSGLYILKIVSDGMESTTRIMKN